MIEFKEVSKTYPGSDRPVVNDLSFEILEGEVCVLVGPSGCGNGFWCSHALRRANVDCPRGEPRCPGFRRAPSLCAARTFLWSAKDQRPSSFLL